MRVTQTRREIQMLDQRIGLVGEEGVALLGLLVGVRLPGNAGDERVSGQVAGQLRQQQEIWRVGARGRRCRPTQIQVELIVAENRRGVVQELFVGEAADQPVQSVGLAREPQLLADLLEVRQVAVGRLLHEGSVGVIRIVAGVDAVVPPRADRGQLGGAKFPVELSGKSAVPDLL